MKSGVLAQTQVIPSVAETNCLTNKQVKGVMKSLFGIATNEIKKNGKLQTCRYVEVEEEGRYSSKEWHQPPHQGASRVQIKSSLQHSEGTCHEEVEGVFAQRCRCLAALQDLIEEDGDALDHQTVADHQA